MCTHDTILYTIYHILYTILYYTILYYTMLRGPAAGGERISDHPPDAPRERRRPSGARRPLGF